MAEDYFLTGPGDAIMGSGPALICFERQEFIQ
jgi:hypothetical protein